MLRARTSRLLVVTLFLLAFAAACAKSAKSYFDSGNQYFDQKKYKEAIVEYRRAIKKDQKFGDAYYRLADCLVKTGDLTGAYHEFQRAADLLPTNKEAQVRAGAFMLLAKQFLDAQTRAEAALKLDPKYVDALILKANAQAQLNKIDSAIESIQQAIQINPLESRSYLNLGTFEQIQGDTKGAEATFQQALKLDPKSVPAHVALANFYLSTGRAADAERLLKAAAALDPKNNQINNMLAAYYISSNRAPEAEPYFKAAADSGDLSATLALADYYAATNRLPEAISQLDKVVRGSKDKSAYAQAQSRLAAIQYTEKKPAEAHQTLAEVLKGEPNNTTALLLDARFLISEKKFDDALDRAKKAVTAEPNNANAHYTLGAIYAAKNDPDEAIKEYNETLRINPRAGAAQVELARIYLARNEKDSALQFAEQAVKNQPGNDQIRLVYIRTLMARGNLAQAETELKPLLASNAGPATLQAQVQVQLGTLLVAKSDPAGARRAYEKALQLDPVNYEALSDLIWLDINEKKPASARVRIDAQLAKTPNDPALLLLSARVFYDAGDRAKNEQTLLKLIQIEPGALEAYELLGRLYLDQNSLEQAREKFEELVKRQPKPVGAQTMIGMILEAQRKTAEAQNRYELVLELDPRAAVASNNLAWILAESGKNLDRALQLARTAKEQLPDSAPVNDTLGWIYVKKGLPSLAEPLLKAAVDKTAQAAASQTAARKISENPTYYYHLGMAYAGNGKKPEAKSSLEKALQLNPNFVGSAEARKKLVEIG